MRNLRTYYAAGIVDFLRQPAEEILGVIHANNISAETTIQQSNTWESEIAILKDQLRTFSDGRILFEYTIPRMGKRVDTVVLYRNIVFLLEFKVGDDEYRAGTYDQVYDYALDLRNFQKESHDKLLVPIMISTRAPRYQNKLTVRDRVVEPLRCNADNGAGLRASFREIKKGVNKLLKYRKKAVVYLYILWYNYPVIFGEIATRTTAKPYYSI